MWALGFGERGACRCEPHKCNKGYSREGYIGVDASAHGICTISWDLNGYGRSKRKSQPFDRDGRR